MADTEDRVTVTHDKGLHARPASEFVQTASEFSADIQVRRAGGDDEVDAKSSIGIMSLGVEPGDEIVITAEGEDGQVAVERLVGLVEGDFES